MSAVITYAKNLATNPKPASLSGITGPVNLAYEKSYSGNTSVRISFGPGEDSFEWIASTDLSDIDPGSAFSGAIRFLPVTSFTIQIEVILEYTDSTEDNAVSDDIEITSSNQWNKQTLPPLFSDPGKTPDSLRVVIHKVSTGAAETYAGGLDIREGSEEADAFVVGDGYNSYWDGTPNASRSVRNAHTYQSKLMPGAQIRYRANYFLVNRMNVIQEDITDRVVSCTINVDLLAEATKSSINIVLDSGDVVQPFTDSWIRPHLTVEHSDGTIEGGLGAEGMLGVYSVEPATEVYDADRNTFTYQGFDLLWILQQQACIRTPGSAIWEAEEGASFMIAPPKTIRDGLISAFEVAGFTEQNGLLSLPNPAGIPQLDQVYSAETGTPLLSYITYMCDGMAWRRPWATLQGQVKTEPIRPLSEEQPDYYFESGANSPVLYPFEVQPEHENIANRVTVFSKWQGRNEVISEIIENEDPNHPFSTVRLGYQLPEGETTSTGETVQRRYIDAPQINAVLLNSREEARVIGMSELEKRGMPPYIARLKTRAMVAQLNAVYELNLTDFEGNPMANQSGQGLYWCVGWNLTLGPPWEMTHNLRRIIPVFEVDKLIKYPHHRWIYGTENHKKRLKKLAKRIKNLKNQIKKRGAKGPTKAQARDLKKLEKERRQKRNRHNKAPLTRITPITG